MTRFCLLFLIALMCAPAVLAQNRRDDYSFYEFYGGYAYTRAKNNADHFDRNGTAKIGGSALISCLNALISMASQLSLIRMFTAMSAS